MIDYKKILWDGYHYIDKKQNQTLLLTAFFKSEAQKARRDEFIDFDIFFLNLKNEITAGKKDIENQYLQEMHRDSWVIISVENGSGMQLDGEFIADKNDPRIQKNLQRIREQQQFIENKGYKNNNWYKFKICYTEKDNSYSTNKDWFSYSIDFTYTNLEAWENIIQQAEQELTPAAAVKPLQAEQKQQITIPDNILQALQQACFIENAAARPLKWTATNSRTSKPNNLRLNKKSLLDLLCLLDYPDSVIKDKNLLKEKFSIEFKAKNYTDITDKMGNLKRPIISEYHKQLSDIVEKSKQK